MITFPLVVCAVADDILWIIGKSSCDSLCRGRGRICDPSAWPQDNSEMQEAVQSAGKPCASVGTNNWGGCPCWWSDTYSWQGGQCTWNSAQTSSCGEPFRWANVQRLCPCLTTTTTTITSYTTTSYTSTRS